MEISEAGRKRYYKITAIGHLAVAGAILFMFVALHGQIDSLGYLLGSILLVLFAAAGLYHWKLGFRND